MRGQAQRGIQSGEQTSRSPPHRRDLATEQAADRLWPLQWFWGWFEEQLILFITVFDYPGVTEQHPNATEPYPNACLNLFIYLRVINRMT